MASDDSDSQSLVLLARLCFRESFSSVGSPCRRARGGLRRQPVRPRTDVVAAFYPLAFAAEQVARAGLAVDEPDAARRGAARPRADGARRRTATGRGARRLRGRRLPAGRRGCRRAIATARRSTSSTPSGRIDGAEGRDPHVWLDPIRYATGRPRDRRARSGDRGAAARLVRRLASLDRDFRARPRPLRAPRDRDEPRRVRVPRRSLRPRAGPARRRSRRRRSPRRRISSASSRTCVRPARRRSSSSRSSRPRSPRRSRARRASSTAVLDPLEGLTAEERRARRGLLQRHARESRRVARTALGCT